MTGHCGSKLGKAGRETVERHYHGRRLAGELLELYREVSASQPAKSGAKLEVAAARGK